MPAGSCFSSFSPTRGPIPSSPRSGLPRQATSTLRGGLGSVMNGGSKASGSGSSTKCTGRSCGWPARIGGESRHRAVHHAAGDSQRDRSRCSAGSAMSAGRCGRCGPCHRPRTHSDASRCRAAPRCSRSRSPRGVQRHDSGCRRLVFRDNPQRFFAGVNDLDRPHDDALERVPANLRRARPPGRAPG